MINHEIIVKMQDDLNIHTAGTNWRSGTTNKGRKIDWDRCIYMESCEAIDSLNWKHWKKIDAPDDLDNLKVEVVDIFHFILSKLISLKGTDATEVYLKDYLICLKEHEDTLEYLEQLIEVSVTHNENSIRLLGIFSRLLGSMEMTIHELYKLYIGKNVLNRFRQDNRYKEGHYIKNWALEVDEVVEDNEVMQRIMEKENDPDRIYMQLNTTYNLVKVLSNPY